MQHTVAVKVGVGKHMKTWNIHEGILRAKCRYFDAAMEHGFAEAQAREFHLKDDDPAVFAKFASLMYSLESIPSDTPVIDCIKLWVLGDKLQASALQNMIIDMMPSEYDDYLSRIPPKFSDSDIIFILQNTLEGSPLRIFCRDAVAYHLITTEDLDTWPGPLFATDSEELRKFAIQVLVVVPGFVKTYFQCRESTRDLGFGYEHIECSWDAASSSIQWTSKYYVRRHPDADGRL